MTVRTQVGVMVVVMLLGLAPQVCAQSAPDAWQVTVAPYLMAAGMNGTAGIGRPASSRC